jgi:EpsI family protein
VKSTQFWVLLLCLFATLLVIHARGDVDHVPQSAPLAQMPATFGQWTSEDIPISPDVLEILGKGDFLNRVYTEPKPDAAGQTAPATITRPVQLFIAYFPTQRSGQSIHSPQNCLPGSGWTFQHSGVTTFADSTGKQYRVGDYVISNGRDKQEVLYWYQSHGRSIANDYKAKLLMLTDAIRYGRTDAALVRVITDIPASENPAEAHERVVNFAKNVTPLLPAYVPN